MLLIFDKISFMLYCYLTLALLVDCVRDFDRIGGLFCLILLYKYIYLFILPFLKWLFVLIYKLT